MSKDKVREDDGTLPEHDTDKGQRGSLYEGMITRVSLDRDVVKHFSTSEQVNDALHMLIDEGRAPKPRNK